MCDIWRKGLKRNYQICSCDSFLKISYLFFFSLQANTNSNMIKIIPSHASVMHLYNRD